jgi:translation initiation factor 6
MKINKATIYNSPFLGVYAYCSKDFCIVPNTILDKELKVLEKNLDTKIIKTQINASSLIGVYLTGLNNKIVVEKNAIKNKELEFLEKENIKVKLVEDYNALGNLFSINSNFAIASPLLKKETIKDISDFLKIDIVQKSLSDVELPGSCLYVNESLFVVSPNISEKEFKYISSKFKVPGVATTLNYGDVFVSNDIISNNNAVLLGNGTSNIEISKIDALILDIDSK